MLTSRTKAVSELKSLIVVAPEHVRAELCGRTLARQLNRTWAMTLPVITAVEHRITVVALQSVTRPDPVPVQPAHRTRPELGGLIRQHPAGPALLAEPGAGTVVAAQLLISWSHHGRVRSEAAFASLAGVAPLEASSGQETRHRLNRGGDRALNRALHTVAITRMRCHPETRAYEARRTLQGKTHRCVKRAIARRLYRVMETATRPTPANI